MAEAQEQDIAGEPELQQQLLGIARGLDDVFNRGLTGRRRAVGFALLVFPFAGHGSRCNYISNGVSRSDICKLMRAQIEQFEQAEARERGASGDGQA